MIILANCLDKFFWQQYYFVSPRELFHVITCGLFGKRALYEDGNTF